MLKLIKEEKIIPVAAEDVIDQSASEIPDYVVNNACQDLVNNLTQQIWTFISEVNSTVATIDYDFKDEDTKKEIIELLNSVVDDSTIIVGILHKVFELINKDKAELIASGESKAEEILSTEEEIEI